MRVPPAPKEEGEQVYDKLYVKETRENTKSPRESRVSVGPTSPQVAKSRCHNFRERQKKKKKKNTEWDIEQNIGSQF